MTTKLVGSEALQALYRARARRYAREAQNYIENDSVRGSDRLQSLVDPYVARSTIRTLQSILPQFKVVSRSPCHLVVRVKLWAGCVSNTIEATGYQDGFRDALIVCAVSRGVQAPSAAVAVPRGWAHDPRGCRGLAHLWEHSASESVLSEQEQSYSSVLPRALTAVLARLPPIHATSALDDEAPAAPNVQLVALASGTSTVHGWPVDSAAALGAKDPSCPVAASLAAAGRLASTNAASTAVGAALPTATGLRKEIRRNRRRACALSSGGQAGALSELRWERLGPLAALAELAAGAREIEGRGAGEPGYASAAAVDAKETEDGLGRVLALAEVRHRGTQLGVEAPLSPLDFEAAEALTESFRSGDSDGVIVLAVPGGGAWMLADGRRGGEQENLDNDATPVVYRIPDGGDSALRCLRMDPADPQLQPPIDPSAGLPVLADRLARVAVGGSPVTASSESRVAELVTAMSRESADRLAGGAPDAAVALAEAWLEGGACATGGAVGGHATLSSEEHARAWLRGGQEDEDGSSGDGGKEAAVSPSDRLDALRSSLAGWWSWGRPQLQEGAREPSLRVDGGEPVMLVSLPRGDGLDAHGELQEQLLQAAAVTAVALDQAAYESVAQFKEDSAALRMMHSVLGLASEREIVPEDDAFRDAVDSLVLLYGRTGLAGSQRMLAARMATAGPVGAQIQASQHLDVYKTLLSGWAERMRNAIEGGVHRDVAASTDRSMPAGHQSSSIAASTDRSMPAGHHSSSIAASTDRSMPAGHQSSSIAASTDRSMPAGHQSSSIAAFTDRSMPAGHQSSSIAASTDRSMPAGHHSSSIAASTDRSMPAGHQSSSIAASTDRSMPAGHHSSSSSMQAVHHSSSIAASTDRSMPAGHQSSSIAASKDRSMPAGHHSSSIAGAVKHKWSDTSAARAAVLLQARAGSWNDEPSQWYTALKHEKDSSVAYWSHLVRASKRRHTGAAIDGSMSSPPKTPEDSTLWLFLYGSELPKPSDAATTDSVEEAARDVWKGALRQARAETCPIAAQSGNGGAVELLETCLEPVQTATYQRSNRAGDSRGHRSAVGPLCVRVRAKRLSTPPDARADPCLLQAAGVAPMQADTAGDQSTVGQHPFAGLVHAQVHGVAAAALALAAARARSDQSTYVPYSPRAGASSLQYGPSPTWPYSRAASPLASWPFSDQSSNRAAAHLPMHLHTSLSGGKRARQVVEQISQVLAPMLAVGGGPGATGGVACAAGAALAAGALHAARAALEHASGHFSDCAVLALDAAGLRGKWRRAVVHRQGIDFDEVGPVFPACQGSHHGVEGGAAFDGNQESGSFERDYLREIYGDSLEKHRSDDRGHASGGSPPIAREPGGRLQSLIMDGRRSGSEATDATNPGEPLADPSFAVARAALGYRPVDTASLFEDGALKLDYFEGLQLALEAAHRVAGDMGSSAAVASERHADALLGPPGLCTPADLANALGGNHDSPRSSGRKPRGVRRSGAHRLWSWSMVPDGYNDEVLCRHENGNSGDGVPSGHDVDLTLEKSPTSFAAVSLGVIGVQPGADEPGFVCSVGHEVWHVCYRQYSTVDYTLV